MTSSLKNVGLGPVTGSYKGRLRGSVALFKVAVSSVQSKLPIKEKLKDCICIVTLSARIYFRTFTNTHVKCFGYKYMLFFLAYTSNQECKRCKMSRGRGGKGTSFIFATPFLGLPQVGNWSGENRNS